MLVFSSVSVSVAALVPVFVASFVSAITSASLTVIIIIPVIATALVLLCGHVALEHDMLEHFFDLVPVCGCLLGVWEDLLELSVDLIDCLFGQLGVFSELLVDLGLLLVGCFDEEVELGFVGCELGRALDFGTFLKEFFGEVVWDLELGAVLDAREAHQEYAPSIDLLLD